MVDEGVLARRLAIVLAVLAAAVVVAVFAIVPQTTDTKPIEIATVHGRIVLLVGDTGPDWIAIGVIALVCAFVTGAATWLGVRWVQRRRERHELVE